MMACERMMACEKCGEDEKREVVVHTHYFESVYTCTNCGAVRTTRDERIGGQDVVSGSVKQ